MNWPAHTYQWFGELEANNTKAWYDDNKAAYAEIEAAALALFNQLAEHDGGGHVKVFRLRRDARFAKEGQPPYKTEQRAGVLRSDGTVWSFEIDSSGITVSSGQPIWDKTQLGRAREALRDPTLAQQLLDAVDAAGNGFHLGEPDLKRPLKELDPDHPNPDLTRYKHLVVQRRHAPGKWLLRSGADQRLVDQWQSTAAFTDWLAKHVGGSDAWP